MPPEPGAIDVQAARMLECHNLAALLERKPLAVSAEQMARLPKNSAAGCFFFDSGACGQPLDILKVIQRVQRVVTKAFAHKVMLILKITEGMHSPI